MSSALNTRTARLAVAAMTAVVAGGAFAPSATAAPTIAQLIGQKLVVAMAGTSPSAGLLARIRAGQVGGVILFGSNVTSATQLVALTGQLRGAAAAGGQPPLLVTTDQEGGSIKRLPWAPPTLSPPQMGALGSATTARSQGARTGTSLACAGVDVDLAPVADVPASTSSFMYQQGRTWSFSPSLTASLSAAFAAGLSGRDVPVMKHFPGIGLATRNTDSYVVTITSSAATLAPGLQPYEQAIAAAIPMIMLSNATYTAYDSANAAGWSNAISVGLLRDTLGFGGVSITDSLSGTAAARGVSARSLAVKAATAGTDMIMITGSEKASAATYARLVARAQDGTIPLSTLDASYARIRALKAGLPAPIVDTHAPTVDIPVSHLAAPTNLGRTKTPVVTTWGLADTCGISHVGLERSVNGGPWTRQSLATPQARSITQSLAWGSTYRYRVRATDGAGNTSAWHVGSAFTPRLRQEAGGVSFSGAWQTVTTPAASNGRYDSSTTAGARATFTFVGMAIGWVAAQGPARGSAAVYIDGTYRTTVSLYAPSFHARRIVYARHWSANGSHTITIVNLGTAGHPRVDVDAFIRLVAS
jgi:beta-N-acetylhexosaminidase